MIEIIQRKEIENSATGNAPAENTATGNIVTENRRTNEKAEDTATFPRNFRQIGTPEGEKHIFIEDYVYTYLHPAFLGMNERRVCILVGRTETHGKNTNIYVNGAFELPEIAYCGTAPVFQEKIRTEICSLIKRYFDGSTLLGWFYDEKGTAPCLTPELERILKISLVETIDFCCCRIPWKKKKRYTYMKMEPFIKKKAIISIMNATRRCRSI